MRAWASNREATVRAVRKLGRARHWPARDLVTTAHALVLMMMVEMMIRFVPLRRLGDRLGVPVDLEAAVDRADRLPLRQLSPRAQQQLRCARRVADVWPFSEGPCLRRALVGGHLIRRLDPRIRLGVTSSDGAVLAHAWLEIDGRPLEAVDDFARFERNVRGVIP